MMTIENNWYWLDGTSYCPECVECDAPAIDAKDATRGQGEGNCGCCGRSLEMTRQDAISILSDAVRMLMASLGEDVGIGGYSDTAAYKLANGDINSKTEGLPDAVRTAISVVGSLEWGEINR